MVVQYHLKSHLLAAGGKVWCLTALMLSAGYTAVTATQQLVFGAVALLTLGSTIYSAKANVFTHRQAHKNTKNSVHGGKGGSDVSEVESPKISAAVKLEEKEDAEALQ